jgi:hypothetical protein
VLPTRTRLSLRQIVERGLNECTWKPYAQKPTTTGQILFLKVQNAYNVVAGGQSDRHASSRVRLIARQAVRPGDYVGNRGKRGSERLALETTFMTPSRHRRDYFAAMHSALVVR